MKVVAKTLVGWVVILIILWILFTVGSLSHNMGFGKTLFSSIYAVVQIFVFSVVCTLGISLIIWIPLGFGVGWVVFKIAGWDKAAEDAQQPEVLSAAVLKRDQQALVNYIKKARVKGLVIEEIILNLRNNGWTAEEINQALNAVK